MNRPARNRVTPLGEIVAVPARGAWMGNRGRLHEGTGTRDVVRNHQSKAWITCALSFKGRRLPQWQPHHYTQLFFLDEAVAFAAGHRPCAECRRADYNAFRDGWAAGGDRPLAVEMDARLHAERLRPRTRERLLHQAEWRDLPNGVFVMQDGTPAVVLDDRLIHWRPDCTYGGLTARPIRGEATVITPPSTVAVLRNGYPVQIGAAR